MVSVSSSPTAETALTLADLGYAVFPIVPGSKRPLTANGLLDATRDSEQIERWFSGHPTANLAVATEAMLVLDVDYVDGRPNVWLANEPEKLLELAAAPMSRTPRGGTHYWFRQPAGAQLRNTAGKIAGNVDTRANGGYVLSRTN